MATVKTLRPFVTSLDLSHLVDTEQAPALVFNEGAHLEAVAGMACARAHNLERMLHAWACASGAEEVTAWDIAAALQPLAEEVLILLSEIKRRVRGHNRTEG